MIFLTIGTHEPFPRLVRAVDAWCAASGHGGDLFGQITDQGAAAYTPGNFKWVGRLTPQEYGDRISRADLIISHAGMGSIITALQLGKPIVVLPRRGHLRETRNDHQYATVQRLGNRPGIFVAEDETRLPVVLDQAVSGLAGAGGIGISRVAEPRLTMAIGRFLAGKPLPEKS
ncbi:MAG: hypothetical protein KDA67_10580 [Rhodobacteraceae bacterium]|nr:hypothetical protein [Paracoccaceae bacterium]